MTVWTLNEPLTWESMALPMQELCHDWHGSALESPARIAIAQDPKSLWFIASHDRPPRLDPAVKPASYHEGLWLWDVAELFIATANGRPNGLEYLEFNLAPNGAWWMAAFSGPRQRQHLAPSPDVRTHSSHDARGWRAALQIPLAWLSETIGWGIDSRINATLILESPNQRFITAADLGGGAPDFHRPQRFAVTCHRRVD